jgi:hypothetical protein
MSSHRPAPPMDANAATSTPCPACGKRAWHLADFDLYYHQDGSENGPCWFVILTGSRTPPVCPTCEREMHE